MMSFFIDLSFGLIVQFAHVTNLITVYLLSFACLRIFIRDQSGIVINLRFAACDYRFSIRRFDCLI